MKKIKSMTYLIIGMVITAIGICFTVIGTIQQNSETEKFQNEVKISQALNLEISEKLTKVTEDKFKQLTKPINVIGCKDFVDKGIESYFEIIAKNTGNNDCVNAELIIDSHSSPLASHKEIRSFSKVPKDSILSCKIPTFISHFKSKIITKEEVEEFKNSFYKTYLEDGIAIVIYFHFEYEWNSDIFKSSQYVLVKSNNQEVYISSDEEFVENDKL